MKMNKNPYNHNDTWYHELPWNRINILGIAYYSQMYGISILVMYVAARNNLHNLKCKYLYYKLQ